MSFADLIQRNSAICTNCFRRTHDVQERNFVIRTHGSDLWSYEVDLPDRHWPTPETEHMDGDVCVGRYNTCCCGIDSGTLRPVSLDKAMVLADRLCDRLEEEGRQVDRWGLLAQVRRQLRKPCNQGRQDSVFASAVASWSTSKSDQSSQSSRSSLSSEWSSPIH